MIQYRAGAVWWRQIDFGDGERRKYFVVLSDPGPDGTVVVAVTTSKGDKQYSDATSASPCAPSGRFYRIDAKREKCFPIDTWVQFDNAASVSVADLQAMKPEQGGFLQTLDDERLRSLLACAKKSDDIPKRYIEQISTALKARVPAKKPEAPKPAAAKGAAPLFVSAEVLSVGTEIAGFCVGCRADYIEYLGIAEVDLTAILRGAKPAQGSFVDDAKACIELFAEQRANCANCKKP